MLLLFSLRCMVHLSSNNFTLDYLTAEQSTGLSPSSVLYLPASYIYIRLRSPLLTESRLIYIPLVLRCFNSQSIQKKQNASQVVSHRKIWSSSYLLTNFSLYNPSYNITSQPPTYNPYYTNFPKSNAGNPPIDRAHSRTRTHFK